MIIPAAMVKVIKFGNSTSTYPDSDDIRSLTIQLDDGKIVKVAILSENKDFSSFRKLTERKSVKNIKSNEIQKLVSDIVFSQDPAIQQMFRTEMEKTGDSRKAAEKLAKKILWEKYRIKKGSVIRIAIALNERNMEITSKMIYTKTLENGTKEYDHQKGIYYSALLPNNLPIEISPIFKEGNFLGLFKIETAAIVRKDQMVFFLRHLDRTASKLFRDGKKPFFPYFSITKKGSHPEAERLLVFLNDVHKRARKGESVDENIVQSYRRAVLSLISEIEKNPQICSVFKSSVPLLIKSDEFSQMFLGEVSSPFLNLPTSITSLNFSTQNPDVKERVKAGIQAAMQSMPQGFLSGFPFKIMSVYNFPSETLPGTADSWGFMKNNIAVQKSVLSFCDSYRLITFAKNIAGQ